jgi:signal transduction histidine kinase
MISYLFLTLKNVLMKNFMFLSILLYTLSIFNIYGQNVNSFLNNTKNSICIDSINNLNVLSRDLTFIDSEKSMEYAQEALRLSLTHRYKIGEGYAYLNLGSLYNLNGLYILGMDYIQKSLTIFKKNNNSKGLANCYISLGLLYGDLYNFEEQIKYYKLSFNIFNKLNIPDRIAVSSHNLGESYYHNKDYKNSRKMTLLSIGLSKTLEYPALLSASYNIMGRIELSSKNYDKAEVYFQKVLEIYRNLGEDSHKITTLQSLIDLAEIYKTREQIDTQINFLNQAAEFAQTHNLPSYLAIIYHEKILLYSKENNQEMVQKAIIEQKVVSENTNLKGLKNKTALVKTSLLLYSLEKQIKLLEQSELKQQDKIENINLLVIVGFISSVILVLFVIKLISVLKKIKITNKTIKVQNDELQSLISARNKLFTIIGHDLRGPVGSFKQLIDYLVSKKFDLNDTETFSKLLQSMQETAGATYDLLENLLLWSETQQNAITFSPVNYNLHEMIDKTLILFHEVSNQKNIIISNKIKENQIIYADLNMITTVIRNLISNAIKFTPNNKNISISITKNEKDWIVSVEDQGVGISKENRNKIFDSSSNFTTFGTNKEKGSGLGLLICQEFVEKHGGKIWVESKEGMGSLFSFTIPINKELKGIW